MTTMHRNIAAASATVAPDNAVQPSRLRRHRSTILIVLGLVAAVMIVIWSGSGSRTFEPLDPDNPDADGAQAVARVLAHEGIDVNVARGADELEDLSIGDDTTVVVTSTGSLGTSTVQRLLDRAGDARLVLVGPEQGVTDELDLDYPSTTTLAGGSRAACADPMYDGLTLAVDVALVYPGSGCFADGEGALLVERDGIVLFGAGDALTNDQVLRADNAAVALRLLGQDQHLVWYVPSVRDLVGNDGVSASSLLPDWIMPGIWLLSICAIALVLWRGRRLGPLATEPLLVVVKAIETTRSRGRLYRKAGDRAHAAAALRRAARTHAATRLRLGTITDEQALIRDIARQVGRPESEIDALIGPHALIPSTDAALIALATDLAELDREVRRT